MSSALIKATQKHFVKTAKSLYINKKPFATSVWYVGSKSTPLGRWDTITNEQKDQVELNNTIEKNIYWANHDHCGGEICKTPQKPDNGVKIDTVSYENDPMWPFLL
jgi:hypothetical protein